jgi:hypothetical protein
VLRPCSQTRSSALLLPEVGMCTVEKKVTEFGERDVLKIPAELHHSKSGWQVKAAAEITVHSSPWQGKRVKKYQASIHDHDTRRLRSMAASLNTLVGGFWPRYFTTVCKAVRGHREMLPRGRTSFIGHRTSYYHQEGRSNTILGPYASMRENSVCTLGTCIPDAWTSSAPVLI